MKQKRASSLIDPRYYTLSVTSGRKLICFYRDFVTNFNDARNLLHGFDYSRLLASSFRKPALKHTAGVAFVNAQVRAACY